MQRRLRPDRALVLTLTLVATLAAGCVQPKDPEVNVTKVEADLVFGVKEPEPVETPATANVGPIAAQPEAGGLDDVPFPDKLPEIFGPPTSSNTPATECPTAPTSATAKGVVDVNITGEPPVGIYKWKASGFQKADSAPAESPGTPINGFEKRLIRNFKKVNDTTTTFEMVQTPFGGNGKSFNVSTFQVKSAAINRETTGSGVPVSGPRLGEADRGVALTKFETFDASGQVTSTFQPSTGVLLLPLPVASGESYQSVGVDPKSGQTLVHDAKVLGRERVDACGEVVDGWAVEAHQVTNATEASPAMDVTFKYLIAPQMGGMPIFEGYKFAADGVTFDLKFNIGQLTPDPLPAG
ncbi:MAG TPA: hypothetical protein VM030_04805 [Acidimicrobiales bacterium]|nr:hypothetical protein [Acidimicrobiales bacterium]